MPKLLFEKRKEKSLQEIKRIVFFTNFVFTAHDMHLKMGCISFLVGMAYFVGFCAPMYD